MSKATKRKHVVKEVLTEYALPGENQQIVKVVASRGNNLHEIVDSDGEKYLVSMPSRFRKNVWIKRGDFIVVEPISEGDKVKAEIISILYQDQRKYIQQEGHWPSAFENHSKTTSGGIIPDDMLPPSDDSDNEDMVGVVVNANRPVYVKESEDDSDESEDDGSYLNSEEQNGEHETNSDVQSCDINDSHNGS